MKSLAILLMLSGAAAAQSPRQALIDCLGQAQSDYAREWAQECAARSLGSNVCRLPRLAAAEVKTDRSLARSECYQDFNAGMLSKSGVIVMPGAGEKASEADDQTERKFRISPQ